MAYHTLMTVVLHGDELIAFEIDMRATQAKENDGKSFPIFGK